MTGRLCHLGCPFHTRQISSGLRQLVSSPSARCTFSGALRCPGLCPGRQDSSASVSTGPFGSRQLRAALCQLLRLGLGLLCHVGGPRARRAQGSSRAGSTRSHGYPRGLRLTRGQPVSGSCRLQSHRLWFPPPRLLLAPFTGSLASSVKDLGIVISLSCLEREIVHFSVLGRA